MPLPKSLDGLLMKTIAEARYNSVFALLDAVRRGEHFPRPTDENIASADVRIAGGTFDEFKSQAFLPYVIFVDADGAPIRSKRETPMSDEYFAEQVRTSLTRDKMTIIHHNDVLGGIRIKNGVFEGIGADIFNSKKRLDRKNELLGAQPPRLYTPSDIAISYAPPNSAPAEGFSTKMTLTSALGFSLSRMTSYHERYAKKLGIQGEKDPRYEELWHLLADSQKPVYSDEGTRLANPHIVVAHASTYVPDGLSGLTRIMGFPSLPQKNRQNRFGEFHSFGFQLATKRVRKSLGISATKQIHPSKVWAYYEPSTGGRAIPVIAPFRLFRPVKDPGLRSPARRGDVQLVGPDEFGFDPEQKREEVGDTYGYEHLASVRAA